MQKPLVALSIATLALTACGTHKKTLEALSTNSHYTREEFEQKCTSRPGGIIVNDHDNNTYCLVQTRYSLPESGGNPQETMNPKVQAATGIVPGQFFVSEASSNTREGLVQLYVGNQLLGNVPGRVLGTVGGTLYFYLNGQQYSGVSVGVWDCYDTVMNAQKTLNRVYCSDDVIPKPR